MREIEARQIADRTLILTIPPPIKQGNWRRRVGIEPDRPKLSPRSNEFEVRASHQTRCASAVNFSSDLRSMNFSIAEASLGNHHRTTAHDAIADCRGATHCRVAEVSASPNDYMALPGIPGAIRPV